MNYRHAYHAGGFADVFKHFVLTLLLQKLAEKDKPFRAIDTHGGIGLYDLSQQEAQKTKEYEQGITKLLLQEKIDPLFQPYCEVIRQLNTYHTQIKTYPGSPWIIRQFLRPGDTLQVSELHPQDYQVLKNLFAHDSQVQTFHQDGYISLKAFLPPVERRGLILIDPPFEERNEFGSLVKGVKEAYRRFATGIYCIWFPIKEYPPIQRFYKDLQALKVPNILTVEYVVNPKFPAASYNGCGLIIINPPWQIDIQLAKGLPLLLNYLGHDHGGAIKIKHDSK